MSETPRRPLIERWVRDRRTLTLLVVIVVAALVAFGYPILTAADRAGANGGRATPGAAGSAATEGSPADAASLRALLARPHLTFRHSGADGWYAHVAVVDLADPSGPRMYLDPTCDRVYGARPGGVCLSSQRSVLTPQSAATVLDAELRPVREVPFTGIPSRARVSPDGTLVATTSFLEGHSYDPGGFATLTVISDPATGKRLVNLEQVPFLLDGKEVRNPDINVWGVTFTADSNRFYATVATQGNTYLVEGDLRARTMRALRGNAECPSVSPDGTRVVYKKRDSSAVGGPWRLAVLDLTTGRERLLAERNSIDDQVEWLDEHTVLYGKATGTALDVWALDVDEDAPATLRDPRLFIHNAWSPAVVR